VSVRDHNLEAVAPVLATFKVSQTVGVDDLADANLGEAVTIAASDTAGPASDGDLLLGKLIALTLSDNDHGKRVATVQIGGICCLPIAATYPVVGNRVVGAGSGAVKQAPALVSDDPAGGTVARGTVLSVNGTTDCLILLN
jgi:hypothetical protein